MQGPQLALSNQSQALAAEAEGDRNLGVLTVEGKSGEDRLLCSLGQPAEGWKTVAAVVDSGAEETVAPPGLMPGRVMESPMQRAGGRYRAANGARIPNLGQQMVAFRTSEGRGCSLRFQVVGAERPLISVSQLAKTGHRVEFGASDGAIVHVQTGRRIKLQKVGGVYLLKMQVRDGARALAHRGSAGFSRPGQ